MFTWKSTGQPLYTVIIFSRICFPASSFTFLTRNTHVTIAAGFGQCAEAVALLLARGANPNAQNKMGLTARQEARGEAMTVYSIIQKSNRVMQDLIKHYPCVGKISSVSSAGLHPSFEDPNTLYGSPTGATALFNIETLDSLQMKAEMGMKLSTSEATLIKDKEDPEEDSEAGITEFKEVAGSGSQVSSPTVPSGSPGTQCGKTEKKTNPETMEGPPKGHILVERGDKCFAFFVRCTTRKHATEQFLELVAEMHNLALYWPFLEWETTFLDPAGNFLFCSRVNR
jgi:hypothetical protein